MKFNTYLTLTAHLWAAILQICNNHTWGWFLSWPPLPFLITLTLKEIQVLCPDLKVYNWEVSLSENAIQLTASCSDSWNYMTPASAVASKGYPPVCGLIGAIWSLHCESAQYIMIEDWEAIIVINDSFSWDFKYLKGKMKTDKKEARNTCDFYGQRLQKSPVVQRAQQCLKSGYGETFMWMHDYSRWWCLLLKWKMKTCKAHAVPLPIATTSIPLEDTVSKLFLWLWWWKQWQSVLECPATGLW